jgi:16S rRNA (guanine966-N2)-methyltransferase
VSIRIYGNREIQTPPGLATRPTPVRVRQALFNIWQGKVLGCRWLDLCSGSGAMAAEALCRGAVQVVAIEESPIASQFIKDNCLKLKGESQFRLINGRVQKFLPSLAGQQFDRIYCDPPYQGNLYQRVLDAIQDHNLLAPGGEIALEHDTERDLGTELTVTNLELCRQKTYGAVSLIFYTMPKTLNLEDESRPPLGSIANQN